MRISDWSSDVCSSDLGSPPSAGAAYSHSSTIAVARRVWYTGSARRTRAYSVWTFSIWMTVCSARTGAAAKDTRRINGTARERGIVTQLERATRWDRMRKHALGEMVTGYIKKNS